MTGANFIDFAAKVAATYSDSAASRSAISRAYYGAFHLAMSLLDRIGSRSFQNANSHVFVQHRLLNCGHEHASRAGRLLQDLFSDRLNADYRFNRRYTENVDYARAAVETARQIQNLIESCEHGEAFAQIKAGVAEYERRRSGG